MDHATELELMDELRELRASKTPFLDERAVQVPVEHYTSEERFAAERDKVLRAHPHALAHASELDGHGAFLRRDLRGLPVLLTRDKSGEVRAFLNVCRHRGAQLVSEESGCKHRFSCPYHAWTYVSSGELIGAPHFDSGFPGQDKGDIALTQLPAKEAYGLVWVVGEPNASFDFDAWFAPLAEDLDKLGMADMHIAAEEVMDIAANWKILVEGGIEAYHFKVAHRDTIGPYFEDNLSSYRNHGAHMRSILPRATMAKLDTEGREDWRIRDHANILYTLFPTTQMLVQQDHLVLITSEPKSAGQTQLRLMTLAPNSGPMAEGKDAAHWQRNHAITMATLAEDFDLGVGIQAGLSSGANTHLTFGRFEGALDAFNRQVDALLD